jgi:hypothetical protein
MLGLGFSLPKVQECYVGAGMKWQFKNIRERAAYALRNPGYTFSTIYRELCSVMSGFLLESAVFPRSEFKGFLMTRQYF